MFRYICDRLQNLRENRFKYLINCNNDIDRYK